MSVVNDLLEGSIDIHVHFGPDYRLARSVDGLEAACEARDVGMRAIVLKSHDYPTAGVAYHVRQVIEGIDIFGCICLDSQVGGLNKDALDVAGKLGAKICWMPTHTAAFNMKQKGIPGVGISLVDGEGKLVPELKDIFALIKKYDMAVCTGHTSPQEKFAVVEGALAAGLKKVVVTHPMSGHVLTLDQMAELAGKGAYIEHCFGGTMPGGHRMDPKEIVDAVRKVGAERTVISSDLGQEQNPKPAEGFRVMIGTLLNFGLTAAELEIMIKKNPAYLLGLEKRPVPVKKAK
ncbi:MAG: hypothetical protein HYX92_10545 [Chloroflexi bacterium]|nr:hypothetical protein [Chloroflexota bacterium]